MNYIMIRVLATSFAIKRGRFTQDSGFDWFGGSVGGGHVGEREREHKERIKDIAHLYLNLDMENKN